MANLKNRTSNKRTWSDMFGETHDAACEVAGRAAIGAATSLCNSTSALCGWWSGPAKANAAAEQKPDEAEAKVAASNTAQTSDPSSALADLNKLRGEITNLKSQLKKAEDDAKLAKEKLDQANEAKEAAEDEAKQAKKEAEEGVDARIAAAKKEAEEGVDARIAAAKKEAEEGVDPRIAAAKKEAEEGLQAKLDQAEAEGKAAAEKGLQAKLDQAEAEGKAAAEKGLQAKLDQAEAEGKAAAEKGLQAKLQAAEEGFQAKLQAAEEGFQAKLQAAEEGFQAQITAAQQAKNEAENTLTRERCANSAEARQQPNYPSEADLQRDLETARSELENLRTQVHEHPQPQGAIVCASGPAGSQVATVIWYLIPLLTAMKLVKTRPESCLTIQLSQVLFALLHKWLQLPDESLLPKLTEACDDTGNDVPVELTHINKLANQIGIEDLRYEDFREVVGVARMWTSMKAIDMTKPGQGPVLDFVKKMLNILADKFPPNEEIPDSFKHSTETQDITWGKAAKIHVPKDLLWLHASRSEWRRHCEGILQQNPIRLTPSEVKELQNKIDDSRGDSDQLTEAEIKLLVETAIALYDDVDCGAEFPISRPLVVTQQILLSFLAANAFALLRKQNVTELSKAQKTAFRPLMELEESQSFAAPTDFVAWIHTPEMPKQLMWLLLLASQCWQQSNVRHVSNLVAHINQLAQPYNKLLNLLRSMHENDDLDRAMLDSMSELASFVKESPTWKDQRAEIVELLEILSHKSRWISKEVLLQVATEMLQ